ncbi:calcium-binding protein [Conexibacter sp. CPCC 206217]|uniref:calcium-binding protein n=1 Tax=Conexibacter sp. CPCC 206217 TaxID=3064574 RepID=UPI0027175604|nr:calcium-binding protein [Conexibacter sp. CPCC 206217]MDO8210557.1 calcium-binding protein [Conexibacter sp. CPCC 206217]
MLRSLLVLMVLVGSLVVAPNASAVITLTYSGTTIGIQGTGDNITYVAFDSFDGTVTVRNSSGVVNASSCTEEYVPALGSTYFHCPGAATALQANYQGGADRLMLENVCMPSITASLGDGPGNFSRPDGCPADQLATVTGGSASDMFIGGPGPDHFDGGGGDDQLRGDGGDDVLQGGPGNDQLWGQDGNDQLLGGDGDDRFRGDAGNDLQDGGAGNDSFGGDDADPGADDIRGGPGFDELQMFSHAGGVAIVLDDVANDGTPGEGDNYHSDLEKITATPGNDTYVGTPGNDVFDGAGGDDVARGGGGNDELTGSSGADQLFGEAGNDTLYGGDGDDRVDGGPGLDSLYGDYSSCSAYGCSAGNDQLFARDGEGDAVNCGSGADSAQVDAIDTVAQDGFQACESVDRAAAPAPVPPAPQPPVVGPRPRRRAAGPPPALSSASVRAGRRRFTLTFALRRATTITITVTRRGARRPLGKVTLRGRRGRSTRTIARLGRRTLSPGRYRVVVRAGAKSQTFAVQVR